MYVGWMAPPTECISDHTLFFYTVPQLASMHGNFVQSCTESPKSILGIVSLVSDAPLPRKARHNPSGRNIISHQKTYRMGYRL